MPFCLTFFSLITLCFAFAVPRLLCLSPSPARHHCLHQVRYCSLSHWLKLAVSHSLSLAVSHFLSLAVSHSLSLAVSHSLSLAVSHTLSLVVSHLLSLAVSCSLFVTRSRNSSVCVSLSLSLISIQDIPCWSKHDMNLPLIIASTTNECLCSWANDLRRDPERVLPFFIARNGRQNQPILI